MTDTQLLREVSKKAKHAGEAPVMPFDQRISALQDFQRQVTPDAVLVLLDEHDRKCDEQYLLGMRAGWNFGTLEDADGFDAAYASRGKLIKVERAGTGEGEAPQGA